MITPTIEVVQKLYEECKGIETFCFFSGINAFPEIVPWMKLSFNYPFKRGVITEPPLLYNHPLWQHKLRFALKDWRYICLLYTSYRYIEKFVRSSVTFQFVTLSMAFIRHLESRTRLVVRDYGDGVCDGTLLL